MTEYANQHFVPQFYFKNFSNGSRQISLLLNECGRVINNAPIKGQCSKKNFYGSQEIESQFSSLEANYSKAICAALQIAWDGSSPFFSDQELSWLFEAILFQRARTAHQIAKTSPANMALFLRCFRDYLEHEGDDDLVRYIDDEQVELVEDNWVSALRGIGIALESVPLIMDLDLYLLRNQTDYPFVFSDAPVVFLNTYLRNVKNRGVLGLQSPGLQIFFPINPWTAIMLIDRDKYGVTFKQSMFYDIFERSDISKINALQFYHSMNGIYFSDETYVDYVTDLWRVHRSKMKFVRSQFHLRSDWLLDGQPTESNLYHCFEPQINYKLDLSFIQCEPIDEKQYHFSHRNPEIVAEHKQWLDEMDELENKSQKKINSSNE